jgi:hypothetical protein
MSQYPVDILGVKERLVKFSKKAFALDIWTTRRDGKRTDIPTGSIRRIVRSRFGEGTSLSYLLLFQTKINFTVPVDNEILGEAYV